MIERVPSELGNIRGAALDDFLAWYASERDAEQLRAVVSSLPPALTSHVRWTDGVPRLVPFTWYPCELVHGVLDGLLKDLSDWERQHLSQQAAEHVMETTLRGLYKAIFKAIASPAMMARFASRLWQLYYDTGDSRVEVRSATSHCGTIAGWRGHHPFLCDVNRHSSAWMYRALGCDHVVVKKVECVADGAPHCATLVSWS